LNSLIELFRRKGRSLVEPILDIPAQLTVLSAKWSRSTEYHEESFGLLNLYATCRQNSIIFTFLECQDAYKSGRPNFEFRTPIPRSNTRLVILGKTRLVEVVRASFSCWGTSSEAEEDCYANYKRGKPHTWPGICGVYIGALPAFLPSRVYMVKTLLIRWSINTGHKSDIHSHNYRITRRFVPDGLEIGY